MSRTVRVYLPLGAGDVDALAGTQASVVAAVGFAVTQRLERTHPDADEEELEYLAFLAAAADAARRLDGAAVRRVVGAADVDAGSLREEADPQDPCRVRLGEPVSRASLVSLHVDEHAGTREQLQWYDITELATVRALLG